MAFEHAEPERLAKIGKALCEGMTSILDCLEQRLSDESAAAEPAHRRSFRDQLPRFVQALGRSLQEPALPAPSTVLLASEGNGGIRWKSSWQLPQVLTDLQTVRRVLLDYLNQQLQPPLWAGELAEIDIWFEQAAVAAAKACAQHQEVALRTFTSRIHQLESERQQQREERAERAERRAEHLQQLAAALSEAEQRERRKLAEMLHDHFPQLLMAARLRLDTLAHEMPDESLRYELDGVGKLITQCIHSSRTLSAELSPPVLYEQGLAAGLSWLVSWMRTHHQMVIEARLDALAEPNNPDTAITLFHLVHELLLKIVRLPGAHQATLQMQPLPNERIQIVIEDTTARLDPGRDPERAEARYGLSSIRERLELLGGCVRLDLTTPRRLRILMEMPSDAPASGNA